MSERVGSGGVEVSVLEVAGGWSLECRISRVVMMFRSADQAEAKAHDLGRRLAHMGHETHVSIVDQYLIPRVTALYFAT